MRAAAVLVAMALLVAGCSGSGPGPSHPDVDAGRTIYGNLCVACHGPGGRGAVGPALAGVVATFPACEDLVRWISLGSDGWRDEVGPVYGEPPSSVGGGMPGFLGTLTPDEVAQVAAFLRVVYADADEDATLTACLDP